MMRRSVIAALVFSCSVATAWADLRYTMTTTVRPSAVPSTQPVNPMFGVLGPILVSMIAPGGAVEMRAIVSDRGSRYEFDKPYTIVPAGGAMIVMADGSVIVLNPAEKTYWRTPRPAGAPPSVPAPTVKIDRTSAFEEIAGVRAERATIDVRLPVPVSPGMAMPGMPAEISVTGEAWLADQYKKYVTTSSLSALMGSATANPFANAGFPMRSVMRSDLFAGQQIESVVTNISEAPAPEGAFDVPAGFTEVAPPRMGLPPMGPGR